MRPSQSKLSVLLNVVIWEGDLSMMDLSVFQHVEQLVRYCCWLIHHQDQLQGFDRMPYFKSIISDCRQFVQLTDA